MQEIWKKKQLQNNKYDNQFNTNDFPQGPTDGHLLKSITIETVGVHEERCWSKYFHVFPITIKAEDCKIRQRHLALFPALLSEIELKILCNKIPNVTRESQEQ